MKKQYLFLSIIIGMFILYGCNNDEEKVTNRTDDAPVEQENGNRDDLGIGTDDQDDDMDDQNDDVDDDQVTGEGLQNAGKIHFTSFDLDIDYADNKEFDVDYENETDGMEAELKDTVKANEHLQGDAAFNRLKPIFESFAFDKNTPDDEVISQVLKAFDLDDNFIEFELEIDFADGTKKEYVRRPTS